jgi:hypothetical protein
MTLQEVEGWFKRLHCKIPEALNLSPRGGYHLVTERFAMLVDVRLPRERTILAIPSSELGRTLRSGKMQHTQAIVAFCTTGARSAKYVRGFITHLRQCVQHAHKVR